MNLKRKILWSLFFIPAFTSLPIAAWSLCASSINNKENTRKILEKLALQLV